MKTPVVLIAFNRPDTTKRIFAEIAKVKPPSYLSSLMVPALIDLRT